MVATRCKTHANLNAMVSRDCWYIYDFLGKNHTMMVNLPGWCRTAWHSDEPSSNPTSLGLIPLPHCKVLKNYHHMYFEEGHLSPSHCSVQPTKELLKPSDDLCSVLILRAGKRVKRPGKPLQGKSPPAEPQQLGLSPFVGCFARRGLYNVESTLYKTWSQSVSWMLS